MHNDSIPWTAFRVPRGKYEWLVMPFGLSIAPQVSQRRIDDIFRDHLDYCMVYIDDVLVASHSEAEHLKHIKAILYEFDKHGIVISETKYELCKQEIDFLGVHIKQGNIVLQDHIVKKILEFPEEINSRKQLQSYLGILNCASDFIKDLAKLDVVCLQN